MLQMILGPARSGKTSWVRQKIALLTENPNNRIFLLVPEQFTFETEKSLYQELGGERFKAVNVTSFTRLATEVFRRYGGIAGRYADDCAKSVLMDVALDEIRDRLEVYEKSARAKGFPAAMLDTVAELKNAGVDPVTLADRASALPDGLLKRKAEETALIYQTYDALLYRAYLDPLDDVTRAEKQLRGTDFFDGSIVFFDEFKGFTANENGLIRLILSRAQEVYFSLCLDLERAEESTVGVFSSVLEVYRKMLRFARQSDVKVMAPVRLRESYFASEELNHLERNLLAPVIRSFSSEDKRSSKFQTSEGEPSPLPFIQGWLCKNEYDEVDCALSALARLVREEGFRYDEVAVITRDLDTYRSKLEAGFKKYGIPHYSDQLRGIANAPLIRFVGNALDCMVQGFTGENVLALLKCGVTPFAVEEVAELENYIYVWNISGKQWETPFTANPRGFQEELTEEDTAVLATVNRVREFTIIRLLEFREVAKDAPGREICAALFTLLEQMQVREEIQRLIEGFYAQGDFEMAQEHARVWDLAMGLLDTLATAASGALAPNRPIKPERFRRLFSLAASACSMGTLPQALDTVIVGSADRIRISGKRAVFVLGVNENILPFTPVDTGVFTDREREQLIGVEIEIAKPAKEKLKEERFIAYKTLTSPGERLFLTARKADIGGTSKTPSVIFPELRKMFGASVIADAEDLDGEFFCKSPGAAFSYLAKTYVNDTSLTASLKQVLGADVEYVQKLANLDRVLEKREFSIQNPKNALALFGKEMTLSPTRVESFYQCPFRYFLEQGLRVYPLRRAELNPLETGNLIHRVLYAVTQKADLREGYNQGTVKQLIKEELDQYIEIVMGGVQDKTSRFLYLYNRMRLSILKIVEQLHEELLQSDFTPCDFELEISADAEVTPLLLQGEDGTTVTVAGKIDRVDCYINKQGEKYIRIVDYKSGKKQFKLGDVLYGLNLQMLIYLQCIQENGKGKYENSLPAGILYMPAAEQAPSLERMADAVDTERQKRKGYVMNGLLLEDRGVLEAMEHSMAGLFIPVSMKKDGDFTAASRNSLISLTELGRVHHYIDQLVLRLAGELHQGHIQAVPLPDSCVYCNYRGVCGKNKNSRVKEFQSFDREEALRRMAEET